MTSTAYQQLWGVVDGAVFDAFNRHSDYLTPKGRKSARTSVVKRVTGTVLSFALQAQRQRELAATDDREATPDRPASDVPPSSAGDGSLSVIPPSIPRVHRFRSKIKSRYRSPAAFDVTTTRLLRAVGMVGA